MNEQYDSEMMLFNSLLNRCITFLQADKKIDLVIPIPDTVIVTIFNSERIFTVSWLDTTLTFEKKYRVGLLDTTFGDVYTFFMHFETEQTNQGDSIVLSATNSEYLKNFCK